MSILRNRKCYFYDKVYCETPKFVILNIFWNYQPLRWLRYQPHGITNRLTITTNVRNGAGYRSTIYFLNYSNKIIRKTNKFYLKKTSLIKMGILQVCTPKIVFSQKLL